MFQSFMSNRFSGQYHLLIAMHVDLASMKAKLQAQQFCSPLRFLADFKQLHHNVIILYGEGSEPEEHAKELLKQVDAEVGGL